MPWKTMDVQEQRVKFVLAAARQEKPFGGLCQQFGISRPTGYRWRERYQRGGLAAIAELSRRPHHSPQRTATELEQRVVEIRRRYPDGGAGSYKCYWRERARTCGAARFTAFCCATI